MEPLHYKRVSAELIEELEEKLLMGRSLVLLGPRYGGKRRVLKHLQGVAEKNEEMTIRLRFLSEAAINSEESVRQLLEEALAESAIGGNGGERLAGRPAHSIFAPLDALRASPNSNRSVYLFASNIDSLAHHVARSFLEGARERVNRGELVAVLSGEQDLRNLVQSPKGEGDFGHKYVLQGCDRAEFERHMMQYVSETNLRFKSPKHAVERLYRLTGGNLYVMRMVLWELMEARVRGSRGKIGVTDIPQSLNLIGVPGIYGAHVFRHGIQLITFDPGCWGDLQTLIRKGRVKADVSKSAPSMLEMAGIALLRRGSKQSEAHLEFASALHKDFVKKYYDARRLGDLYASEGEWEKAFALYETLPPAERIRPSGVEDLAQVEGAVRSLGSSLYVEAAQATLGDRNNLSAIEDRFINGSRYLLGFSEISFWQRTSSRGDDGWQWMQTPGGPLKSKQRGLIASFLPDEYPAPHGPWELPAQHERHRQYAVVTIINLPSDARQVAVVLSDLAQGAAISRERARLARTLLRELATAYVHAEEINHVKERLDIRDKQVKIMNSIFGSLGSKLHDVNDVLERAARRLKWLGYRRVIFSLVNPEEQWMRGVVEKSDDLMPPADQLVNVRLNDENNLHAKVVREGVTVAVPDARRDRRGNPLLVKKGKVRVYALIPMLKPGGRAIGTIHVERKDGALPTEEEMSDLKFFGMQLAVAIEQIERVNLLETALDKIPEPMIIVDRAGRRRYANRPAAALFGVAEKWERRSDLPTLAEELRAAADSISTQLNESLSRRSRLSSHYKGIGQNPNYRGVVLTDYIEDWRHQVSGGFVHIQDFNYLRRIFEAAQIIGGASDFESAMRRMLEAMKHLGHQWARLYKVDNEENPRRLISHLSYGHPDAQVERKFNKGKIVLADRSKQGHIDWQAIEHGKPMVFCWKEELDPEDLYTTPYGLRAINKPRPDQPAEIMKHPGDLWIDFPLMTRGGAVLGKICLQCDEHLRPEEFELLKVLSEVAAFLMRESKKVEDERSAMRMAAQKTIETIGHNLITRFGGFSPIGGRYKLLEEKYAELKPINKDFFNSLGEAVSIAERARNLLGIVRPVKTAFDLLALLRSTLPPSMPEGKLRVTADSDELEVVADGHLLATAFHEMIQNSKDALPDPAALEVTVHVESRAPDLLQQGSVRMTVSDNGPGIPPHISNRVFDEFFTHRPGREPGTGFGLDFVRRVFEAHDGVWHVGAPERGAEIVVGIRQRPSAGTPEEEETIHVPLTDS